jgi:hypothetical protein
MLVFIITVIITKIMVTFLSLPEFTFCYNTSNVSIALMGCIVLCIETRIFMWPSTDYKFLFDEIHATCFSLCLSHHQAL